jgi:protein-S-isoprenylcysteine O-methyltransferase Ste14
MIRLLAAARSVVYIAGFVFLWGWLALKVRPIGGGRALPDGSRPLGAVLMILGGAVVLWCAGWFVVAGRGTPAHFDAPRSFVEGGPYRWVRNPMYIGGLAVLIGFGLWNGSPSMVLFAVPAALLAHLFVVFVEEPALRRRFDGPYEDYTECVRRWVPGWPGRVRRRPSGSA